MDTLIDALADSARPVTLTLTDGRSLTGSVDAPRRPHFPGAFEFLDTQENEVVHVAIRHVVTVRMS